MTTRDIAFYTHLISLGLTACAILFADSTGFQWIRGKIEVIQEKTLSRLHWAVGIGLGLMLGSGSVLFWPLREYLLSTPAFYIKMAFVLALIVNSFVIDKLMRLAIKQPFQSLSQDQKTKLYISGAVSTVCWLGAATSAFFLF